MVIEKLNNDNKTMDDPSYTEARTSSIWFRVGLDLEEAENNDRWIVEEEVEGVSRLLDYPIILGTGTSENPAD